MNPLVVAVAGATPTASKVAARLMRQLVRRGFRVRILRAPSEERALDGDIVLVPCRLKKVDELAQQLEQEWTENWAAWYSSSKPPERKQVLRRTHRRKS